MFAVQASAVIHLFQRRWQHPVGLLLSYCLHLMGSHIGFNYKQQSCFMSAGFSMPGHAVTVSSLYSLILMNE